LLPESLLVLRQAFVLSDANPACIRVHRLLPKPKGDASDPLTQGTAICYEEGQTELHHW